MATCSIDGCERRSEKRGWCGTHYSRWRKHGDPLVLKRINYATPEEGFSARSSLDPKTGCINWTGSSHSGGYGKLYTTDGIKYAHRYSWERVNGEIPEGMHIDHVCRNRKCVNVEHLRLATNKQNHENLSGARSDSSSGIRGAVWNSQKGKYIAQVWHNGKRHYGGVFDDPEAAGEVAAKMRAELFTHH
jgi:hypothetical protein